MDAYRTEEEQLAALKTWFQAYGSKVLIGILVVAAVFFGLHYQKSQKQAALDKASILYTQLVRVMDAGELDKEENKLLFDEIYGYLSTDHKDSVYAAYAAFLRASLDVKADDLERAEQTLAWILERKNPPEITELARLRLARVQAATGNVDSALTLLSEDSKIFTAEFAEAKGDVLLAGDKKTEALQAYEEAKAALVNPRAGSLLDMKINSLRQNADQIITIKH